MKRSHETHFKDCKKDKKRRWEEEGGQERIIGGKYEQSMLYPCMEI
jgi:hypothetical protein